MRNTATTAFLFPGQGSQFVGMGAQLARSSSAAREVFRTADDRLGIKLSKLCWEGPAEELNDTYNTQPALYVCSMAALRTLEEAAEDTRAAYAAGHSLGEITALAAARTLEFEDGLDLVRERGRLMKLAGERQPGGMAAILKLDLDQVAKICSQACAATGLQVQLANDNCPGQLVISGHHAALDKAMALAKAAGAKRAIRIPVSIAAHSALMKLVVDKYRRVLNAQPFKTPQITVIANATVEPLTDPIAIRRALGAQLTSPVRWTETIQLLRARGVTDFIELGSKDVLTGLLRRIDPEANGHAVGTLEAIEKLVGKPKLEPKRSSVKRES